MPASHSGVPRQGTRTGTDHPLTLSHRDQVRDLRVSVLGGQLRLIAGRGGAEITMNAVAVLILLVLTLIIIYKGAE